MDITAERMEKVRDLKTQIGELTAEDQGEILFIDASPQRKLVTLYSMLNGEASQYPRYRVPDVLEKRLPDGRFAFTADKDKAPEYKKGNIKCFLHPESPDRPIVKELGLGGITCPAGSLANPHSKRIHAQHRHKQEWAAVLEFMAQQKEAETQRRQEQQLEATLAIANQGKSRKEG